MSEPGSGEVPVDVVPVSEGEGSEIVHSITEGVSTLVSFDEESRAKEHQTRLPEGQASLNFLTSDEDTAGVSLHGHVPSTPTENTRWGVAVFADAKDTGGHDFPTVSFQLFVDPDSDEPRYQMDGKRKWDKSPADIPEAVADINGKLLRKANDILVAGAAVGGYTYEPPEEITLDTVRAQVASLADVDDDRLKRWRTTNVSQKVSRVLNLAGFLDQVKNLPPDGKATPAMVAAVDGFQEKAITDIAQLQSTQGQ